LLLHVLLLLVLLLLVLSQFVVVGHVIFSKLQSLTTYSSLHFIFTTGWFLLSFFEEKEKMFLKCWDIMIECFL
jgi:hypothetical protein